MWNLRNGRELGRRLTLEGDVADLEVAPDGRRVAVATNYYAAWLWRPGTSRKQELEHPRDVLAVAFSADGRTLATGSADNTARLWDVRSGREKEVLRGHADSVEDLDFTRDGRFLSTAGRDRTAKIWDVQRGRVFASLGVTGADASVSLVRFARDGRRLVLAGTDGAVRIKTCEGCGSLDDVIAAARRLVPRKLTRAERDRYLPSD
jgi:WD40 repeat protein